jgi:hypothetical protein
MGAYNYMSSLFPKLLAIKIEVTVMLSVIFVWVQIVTCSPRGRT